MSNTARAVTNSIGHTIANYTSLGDMKTGGLASVIGSELKYTPKRHIMYFYKTNLRELLDSNSNHVSQLSGYIISKLQLSARYNINNIEAVLLKLNFGEGVKTRGAVLVDNTVFIKYKNSIVEMKADQLTNSEVLKGNVKEKTCH